MLFLKVLSSIHNTYNIHTAVPCNSDDGVQRPEIYPNDTTHIPGVIGSASINCWVSVEDGGGGGGVLISAGKREGQVCANAGQKM